MSKATYDVLGVTYPAVYIRDMNVGMSVTNDAYNVVAELHARYGPRRIFYYDSMGFLDELLVSADGEFAGFNVLSPESRRTHEAIIQNFAP